MAALAQLVAQGLTFLVSIVLARQLDVAAYGIFVFGFAFPSWFLLLISLGLDDVMMIDIAADPSRASRYLTTVGSLRLLTAAVAVVALWAGTLVVLADPLARTVTLLLGISSVITSYSTTFLSVFRGFEKFQYAALVTIIERGVTVSAAIAILLLGYGLMEVSFAFLVGSVVMLGVSALVSRRGFAWFVGRPGAREARQLLRRAVPFAMNGVVATFTYTPGLVLLTLMQGPASTGIFNAAFTLVLGLYSFLSLMSMAALPMMSRIQQESWDRLPSVLNQIQRLSVVVGVPIAFGGWLYAAPLITAFYGNRFLESAECFRVLILSIAIETATMGIGPALAATGHMQVRVNIGALGAVLMTALSALLIPSMGPLGVAYGFLASCVVSAVLSVAVIARYIAPLRVGRILGKTVVAGAVMSFVLLSIPGLVPGVGILLGAGVYFAVLFSLRGISLEDRIVVWNAVRGALFR